MLSPDCLADAAEDPRPPLQEEEESIEDDDGGGRVTLTVASTAGEVNPEGATATTEEETRSTSPTGCCSLWNDQVPQQVRRGLMYYRPYTTTSILFYHSQIKY